MMLSTDRTKVFFAVPKTGSFTMRSLLAPLSIELGAGEISPHHNRNFLGSVYREFVDANITQDELDSITGYAFWRDPVDRFKSQLSYARQASEFYMAMYPEYFGPGAQYDLTTFNLPKRMTNLDYNKIPKRVRDEFERIVTPESFFERIRYNMTINLIMFPQREWFAQPNMVALNYHDFTNEARQLVGLFGGDMNVAVPALNVSSTFLPDLLVPPHLEEWIRQIYLDDYMFDPRNPQQ
jgi:hypothetical protein